MTKRLPLPTPDSKDAWRMMCEYITSEATLLMLEKRANPSKEYPRVYSIPNTEHEVITFYAERLYDPIHERLGCAFHISVQGINTHVCLQCLHYYFFEDGHAEIRSKDQVMIIMSFSTWNEGVASLFTVISLSIFRKNSEIAQYLRHKGIYQNNA